MGNLLRAPSPQEFILFGKLDVVILGDVSSLYRPSPAELESKPAGLLIYSL
jgi:hypothetical protein